jgi:hypothetical protein
MVYPGHIAMPRAEYFSLARVYLNSTIPKVHPYEIESSFRSCQ